MDQILCVRLNMINTVEANQTSNTNKNISKRNAKTKPIKPW